VLQEKGTGERKDGGSEKKLIESRDSGKRDLKERGESEGIKVGGKIGDNDERIESEGGSCF